MVNSPEVPDPLRESLSALMDGDIGDADTDRACREWAANPQARECWHTYHLIGDVLRSDELAADPARDSHFVGTLRERLAREPVALPVAAAAPHAAARWGGRLMAPLGVAAGFAAVAGVVVVMRGNVPDGSGTPAVAGAAAVEMTAMSGQVIRDARLDRYLAAHRKVANGASVMVPGAVVRSVDTIVLEQK